jgi:hypothetical protein
MRKYGLLCLIYCMGCPALAAESDLVGKWDLTIQEGRMSKEGLLEIRATDDGYAAWVEGGIAPLVVDGNRIEVAIDDRATTGGRLVRYLRGELNDGSLSGEYGPDHEATAEELALCKRLPLACMVPTGTWTATPHVPPKAAAEAVPVDLSGVWSITARLLNKYTSDLTTAGQAWKDEYDVKMDLPGQRCQSTGLVNGWGFRGTDPEIFQTDTQITMLVGNEYRRIYLDGRQPPEYTDWYPMGFSSGHWEGSTLVVETTHLQPSVREWMGDPVGENARVVERFWLDEKNDQLVGVLTLYDSENYNEPPMKHARWRRAPKDEIRFPSLCDPDSFYRELYDDGMMEEYWKRASRRY